NFARWQSLRPSDAMLIVRIPEPRGLAQRLRETLVRNRTNCDRWYLGYRRFELQHTAEVDHESLICINGRGDHIGLVRRRRPGRRRAKRSWWGRRRSSRWSCWRG